MLKGASWADTCSVSEPRYEVMIFLRDANAEIATRRDLSKTMNEESLSVKDVAELANQ